MQGTAPVQQFGKAPTQFPPGLKQYPDYLRAGAVLPQTPEVLDGYTRVAQWALDGNGKYGDCDMAAAAHAIHYWNVLARSDDPVPTLAEVLAEYRKLSRGMDAGLIEAEVLKTWHRTGLWGNRIVGYAPLDLHNLAMLRQAVYLYGVVFAGIRLTNSSQHQFKKNQRWSLVEGWNSEAIIGAHCVPIVGYDRHSFYVVSWGRIQELTCEWWNSYAEEAWAILPHQLEQARGYAHLNLAQLQADLKTV